MSRAAGARGNFVSEWFGYRVYPTAYPGLEAQEVWDTETCPYLSSATGERRRCVKNANSIGVCSISTQTAAGRRDWLVCPYRALDPNLLNEAVARLFGVHPDEPMTVQPAVRLSRQEDRDAMGTALSEGARVFIYLDQKLGGEVTLRRTPSSPEFSMDVTILEVVLHQSEPCISRFGALEIQTMDFHGSYRHAVKNLKDGLRLHPNDFPMTLDANQQWISEGVEGPNLSNVFKRTFYQMAFKFQLGRAAGCAGTVLAIPRAVWESWRHHLGDPTMERGEHLVLGKPGEPMPSPPIAWIFSFDLDHSSTGGPDRVRLDEIIETSAEALAYWSLEVAPVNALGFAMSPGGIPRSIAGLLDRIWPALARNVKITQGLDEA